MELTPTEQRLIAAVRSLQPMESLLVRSDPQGNPKKIMVKRVYTEWINDGVVKPVPDLSTD